MHTMQTESTMRKRHSTCRENYMRTRHIVRTESNMRTTYTMCVQKAICGQGTLCAYRKQYADKVHYVRTESNMRTRYTICRKANASSPVPCTLRAQKVQCGNDTQCARKKYTRARHIVRTESNMRTWHIVHTESNMRTRYTMCRKANASSPVPCTLCAQKVTCRKGTLCARKVAGMCHTVIRDVQHGTIRVIYDTAYYTNTPYDTSLESYMRTRQTTHTESKCKLTCSASFK